MLIKQLRVLASFNVAQAAKTVDRRMRTRMPSKATPGKVSVIVPYKFIGVTNPNKDIQLLLKLCATLYDDHACFAMLTSKGILVIRWPMYFNTVQLDTTNGVLSVQKGTGVKSMMEDLTDRLTDLVSQGSKATSPVYLATDFYSGLTGLSVSKSNLLSVTDKALLVSSKNRSTDSIILWGQYNQYVVPVCITISDAKFFSKIPLITNNQGAIVSPGKKSFKLEGTKFDVGTNLLRGMTGSKNLSSAAKATKAGICKFLGMAVEKTVADLDPKELADAWEDLGPAYYSFDLEDSAKSLGMYCAGSVLDDWASSSKDTHSINMQRAVQQMFKVNTGKGSYWEKQVSKKKKKKKGIPTPELYTALATAMYKRTQAIFKEKGIKGLYLARGMELEKLPQFMKTYKWEGTVNLNPLSSFSSSVHTARDFGKIVLGGYFKAEQIFCCAGTGMGCLNEQEFLVIGGPHKVKGINPDGDMGSSILKMFKSIPIPPQPIPDTQILKWAENNKIKAPPKIFHSIFSKDLNRIRGLINALRAAKAGTYTDDFMVSLKGLLGIRFWLKDTILSVLNRMDIPEAVAWKNYLTANKKILNDVTKIEEIPSDEQFKALFDNEKELSSLIIVSDTGDNVNIDDQQTNKDWIKVDAAPNVDDQQVNADWVHVIANAPKEKGKQYDAWVKKYNLSEKQAARLFQRKK